MLLKFANPERHLALLHIADTFNIVVFPEWGRDVVSEHLCDMYLRFPEFQNEKNYIIFDM